MSSQVYSSQLMRTFVTQFFGLIASFVTITVIASLLDAFGRPMSWYSKPHLIFFLYIVPTIFSVIAVFYFSLSRQKKVKWDISAQGQGLLQNRSRVVNLDLGQTEGGFL